MFTESQTVADLLVSRVKDSTARTLLYQARVNLQLFEYARERVQKELGALNMEDFARTQTCHMTGGIFGAEKHAAKMMEHKEGVLCFLMALVTSAYRLVRSISAARRNDKGTDWKAFRSSLNPLEEALRGARNFLEHLDEAIAQGQISEGMDCSFSRNGVLAMTENGTTTHFDFTSAALEKIPELYWQVIRMLEARKALENEA